MKVYYWEESYILNPHCSPCLISLNSVTDPSDNIILQLPLYKYCPIRLPDLNKKLFLAATAALEVQMLVCLSVGLSVTLATTVLKLKTLKFLDFRTSEGPLKDFRL